jgi:hypothetical protein
MQDWMDWNRAQAGRLFPGRAQSDPQFPFPTSILCLEASPSAAAAAFTCTRALDVEDWASPRRFLTYAGPEQRLLHE